MASSGLLEKNGVRIAVEGCGHGTLNAIYATVQNACKERNWDGVDLLIIGGDFQAVRNAADLNVMSVPPKYREMGDFHEYYSGARKAPYLTIFVGGNHEAAAHLWELYYGGWVAPNIYYMGAANVLRFGPLRIAGMSGIWKGFDYRKQHHERLPFNRDDIKSFYHVRELDVRKLLQLRTQVDIGISHDWPRAIEKHGNKKRLFQMKPDFEAESRDGSLGNPAAEYVLDRLRPPFWFSAHLHCKFAAIKDFDAPKPKPGEVTAKAAQIGSAPASPVSEPELELESAGNPDEIDLDMEDDDGEDVAAEETLGTPYDSHPTEGTPTTEEDPDTDALRAQLPMAFAKRAKASTARPIPGQPVPAEITNKTTRFLALDKCLPGRKFLQLMEIPPSTTASSTTPSQFKRPFHLHYDPEWLAIVRVFHPLLRIGDRTAATPPDEGEAHYLPLIAEQRAWVDKHVVARGKLAVPEDFVVTAPVHKAGVDPEKIGEQPAEWTNPQTARFCDLLGVVNLWDASEEARKLRRELGPAPDCGGGYRGGRGRGGGRWRGGGRGRGGRGWRGGRGRGH